MTTEEKRTLFVYACIAILFIVGNIIFGVCMYDEVWTTGVWITLGMIAAVAVGMVILSLLYYIGTKLFPDED